MHDTMIQCCDTIIQCCSWRLICCSRLYLSHPLCKSALKTKSESGSTPPKRFCCFLVLLALFYGLLLVRCIFLNWVEQIPKSNKTILNTFTGITLFRLFLLFCLIVRVGIFWFACFCGSNATKANNKITGLSAIKWTNNAKLSTAELTAGFLLSGYYSRKHRRSWI